jgi:hypothetical protein
MWHSRARKLAERAGFAAPGFDLSIIASRFDPGGIATFAKPKQSASGSGRTIEHARSLGWPVSPSRKTAVRAARQRAMPGRCPALGRNRGISRKSEQALQPALLARLDDGCVPGLRAFAQRGILAQALRLFLGIDHDSLRRRPLPKQ